MDCKKSLTLILTIICFLALVGMGVVLFVLYTEIQAHTTTLEGDAQQLQTELNATKQSMALTLNNETQQLQTELNATKQELNTQKSETQVCQRKLKNKEKQLQNETQQLQTELNATKQELNTQKSETQVCQRKLKNKEKQLKKETEDLEQQLKTKEGELNAENQRLQTVQTELDAAKQELITKKNEVQQLETELDATKQELNTKKSLEDKRRSCKGIRMSGTTTSGSYCIQPNPLLPAFSVTCSFSGATATTVVNHDSEMEIEMSKCQSSKCYGRSITYTATIAQIRALIELGGNCRQHLKYRCYESFLHLDSGHSGWDTWDGRFVSYLGGGGGRKGYCACGVAGTCASSSKKCNCESNDLVWREDSGYLTVKDDLPVTKLYFADSDSSYERGLHTLGPLECTQ